MYNNFQLASFGLNIVLISRSPSKLQATAQEIRKLSLCIFSNSSSVFSPAIFLSFLFPVMYTCFFLSPPAGEINPFIQVRTVAVDFTKDKSLYKEIALAISDLDVGVLVNNVGLCVGFCHPFSDIGDAHILDDVINW